MIGCGDGDEQSDELDADEDDLKSREEALTARSPVGLKVFDSFDWFD